MFDKRQAGSDHRNAIENSKLYKGYGQSQIKKRETRPEGFDFDWKKQKNSRNSFNY